MKRFIFAKEFTSYASIGELNDGQLGFYVLDPDYHTYVPVNNAEKYISENYKNTLYFVLNKKGEYLHIPISTNHFTATATNGYNGNTFHGSVTIPEPTVDGHYTIILVKKGVKFNERNRWTASIPVKVGEDVATITAKLGKYFVDNSTNLNIYVDGDDTHISIVGKNPREDFNIILADELSGAELTIENAESPVLDAAWINDFAAKCASDAGYNYTYQEPNINLGCPFDIVKEAAGMSSSAPDNVAPAEYILENGFDAESFVMFNLRFAVPRDVKTRDEVVHQTLHILIHRNFASDLYYIISKFAPNFTFDGGGNEE